MKKKVIVFFVLIFFNISIYAATVNGFGMYGAECMIKISGNTGNLTPTFDEDSRVFFLEIPNTTLTKGSSNTILENEYIESGTVEQYDGTVGILFRLKNNVGYNMKKTYDGISINFIKNAAKKRIVVIDPGHGGKDPGTNRGKYVEKEIALSVSKYLTQDLLNDFNVIITRDEDVFVPLGTRPKIGNNAGAKLFVSIHANSATNTAATGVEVFYFSKKSSPYAERIAQFENSVGERFGENTSAIVQISGEISYKKNQEESIDLARKITDKLSYELEMKNRGIHGANFAVLRGFNGPSVLVEIGFISNEEDAEKLYDDNNQRLIAKSIADMVRAYYDR